MKIVKKKIEQLFKQLSSNIIYSHRELIWQFKYHIDRLNQLIKDNVFQDNKYFKAISRESIYHNIKKYGNCQIYALILCSNEFAHDLILFEFLKKIKSKN